MLFLDPNPDFFHLQHHFGAKVLQGVVGRNREVAFFVAGLVAEVAAFLAAVPGAFRRLDVVVAGVLIGVVTDAIEDEEFRLGTEVRGIGDAG